MVRAAAALDSPLLADLPRGTVVRVVEAVDVGGATQGSKRVIKRRFKVSVPRARVPKKSIHASRPFREMIARPKISQNEWKPAEI